MPRKPPQPTDNTTWQPNLATPSAWNILYSVQAQAPTVVPEGLQFNIPRCDGEQATCGQSTSPQIDYVTTACPPSLVGNSIRFTVEIQLDPGAFVRQTDDGWGGATPPRVRLLIRRSNELTALPYRWWSIPKTALGLGFIPMTAGIHTIEQPLGPTYPDGTAAWKSVMTENSLTHPTQFADAKKYVTSFGWTYGGNYAGHGNQVTLGACRFIVRELQIIRG